MIQQLTIALFCLVIMSGCGHRQAYEKLSGSIDSTSASVRTVLAELETVDTAAILKSLSIYRAYRDFMVSDYADTLTMTEGHALARHEKACLQLEAFLKNRRLLMDRARKIRSQLTLLRQDAAEKTGDPAALKVDLDTEKAAAAELSAASAREFELTEGSLAQVDSSIGLIRKIIGNNNRN